MCRGEKEQSQSDMEEKVNNVLKLIENIAFFTASKLVFKIVTNYEARVVQATLSRRVASPKVSVAVADVWLPDDMSDMMMAYKPCVSAKIFLHDMFPQDDAGIVLDTDIIVMEDLAKLWSIFKEFDSMQLAGLAPVETHYSNVNNIPYYGPVGVGLNAGIMLFNFTRMRNMVGGGFTEAVRYTWRTHRKHLQLMEQDILNVIFAKSPQYVYELPCDWNFHVFQCKPDLTEKPAVSRQKSGLNLCPSAAKVYQI